MVHGEYGPIVAGTLDVASVDMSNTSLSLWSRSGNQGTEWKQDYVTIGAGVLSDYMLQITATVNDPVSSDISIDDIKTTSGPCTDANKPATGELYCFMVCVASILSGNGSIPIKDWRSLHDCSILWQLILIKQRYCNGNFDNVSWWYRILATMEPT